MKNKKILTSFLTVLLLLSIFVPLIQFVPTLQAQAEDSYFHVALNQQFYLRGESVEITVTSNTSTAYLLRILNPMNLTVFEEFVTPNVTISYQLPFDSAFGWYYVYCGVVTTWFRIYESFSWNIKLQPYIITWKNINYTFCSNGTIIAQKFDEVMVVDLTALRLLIIEFGFDVSAFYDERHFQVLFSRLAYSVNLTFTFLDKGCKFRVDGKIDHERQFTFKFSKEKLKLYLDRINIGQLFFDYSDMRKAGHTISYNGETGEVTVTVPPSFSLDPLISFDSTSSTSGIQQSFSWFHTSDSLSNRLLLVGVSIKNTASQTVSSVTYDDVDLTFLRSDTNGIDARTEIWYLVNQTYGTKTIAVTLSASSEAVCGAVSLLTVNQTFPLTANNGATGSSTSPSASLTSAGDDWLFGVLGFGTSAQTSDVFSDGFEDGAFTKWTDGGTTTWIIDTTQKQSGTYSALCGPTNDGYLTSDNIDMTNATQIGLSFWIRDDDLDNGDGYLYYYDNTGTYDQILDLNSITGNTEDTWIFYSTVITDSQYFHSQFRIRFWETPENGENCWIDNVLINKTVTSLGSATEGDGQTNRWNLAVTNIRGRGSTKADVTAGSQSVSWILSNSASWTVSVVSVAREFGTVLFNDGFESGDESAWTSDYKTTGETAAPSTEQAHHGTYSEECTSNGGGGTEQAIVYKTGFNLTEAYYRAYVKVTQNGISDNGDRTYFLGLANAAMTYTIGAVGWEQNNGILSWMLMSRNRGTVSYSTDATRNLNEWYCIELYVYVHASAGAARLYVNGNLILEQTDLDTNDGGNIDIAIAGLYTITNCGPCTAYVDCVVVADAYIGPEVPPAEERTITITETLAKTPLLRALQEQLLIFQASVTHSFSSFAWLDMLFTFFFSITQMANTIHAGEGQAVLIETAGSQELTRYWQEQSYLFTVSTLSSVASLNWFDGLLHFIASLFLSPVSAVAGEGQAILTETTNPQESTRYWQEQLFVRQESTAFSSTVLQLLEVWFSFFEGNILSALRTVLGEAFAVLTQIARTQGTTVALWASPTETPPPSPPPPPFEGEPPAPPIAVLDVITQSVFFHSVLWNPAPSFQVYIINKGAYSGDATFAYTITDSATNQPVTSGSQTVYLIAGTAKTITITLNPLPDGKYYIKVTALPPASAESHADLTIESPFYGQAWFLILTIAIAMALLIIYKKYFR